MELTPTERRKLNDLTLTFKSRIISFKKILPEEDREALSFLITKSNRINSTKTIISPTFIANTEFCGLEPYKEYTMEICPSTSKTIHILKRSEKKSLQTIYNLIDPEITFFVRREDYLQNSYLCLYYTYLGHEFEHFELPPIQNQFAFLGMELEQPYTPQDLHLKKEDSYGNKL